MVNAKGKNVEESLTYVKWLTEKEQASPSWRWCRPADEPGGAGRPVEGSPAVQRVRGPGGRAQRVSTPRAQRVDEALIKGVQALLLKEKTVEQMLDDADRAQKG